LLAKQDSLSPPLLASAGDAVKEEKAPLSKKKKGTMRTYLTSQWVSDFFLS